MVHCKWSNCKFSLHYIQHLLLDLLEFVLHLHHDVLHLGVVALAACGVDFASHLLCYETELLALSVAFAHCLAEVGEVVGEALFLLVDVEFLDVVDEFLLESVVVILYAEALLEAVEDALAYLLGALLLIGYDAVEQGFYVVFALD